MGCATKNQPLRCEWNSFHSSPAKRRKLQHSGPEHLSTTPDQSSDTFTEEETPTNATLRHDDNKGNSGAASRNSSIGVNKAKCNTDPNNCQLNVDNNEKSSIFCDSMLTRDLACDEKSSTNLLDTRTNNGAKSFDSSHQMPSRLHTPTKAITNLLSPLTNGKNITSDNSSKTTYQTTLSSVDTSVARANSPNIGNLTTPDTARSKRVNSAGDRKTPKQDLSSPGTHYTADGSIIKKPTTAFSYFATEIRNESE